jgi:hypothetical protein
MSAYSAYVTLNRTDDATECWLIARAMSGDTLRALCWNLGLSAMGTRTDLADQLTAWFHGEPISLVKVPASPVGYAVAVTRTHRGGGTR